MAKQFHVRVDLERCKGCELCVDACPRDLLIMSKRLNTKGYRVPDNHSDERCVGCRQCVDMCPEAAIEIDKEARAVSAEASPARDTA
ncbi:MAG: 4Fe-4S dicluster domain-containing protein [Verrucomicrobia bacterium]|nr:4Fe-4S dicluster domain-containing protein [Verrucomicrobiota bacterium]MBT7065873.1 4Fe-4S dicluster domain-containing protein [Verrucomicrobiota bacterium]MBT7701107.1 4Fe-4S dicluster domain-containing protein [Verrucomicrobiota bacterium]